MPVPDPAAVAAARTNLRQLEQDRAARPHCTVSRGPLAMALKSLGSIFEHPASGDSVVVAFDGRMLSFDCNGLKTVVSAAGTAWPARYKIAMAAIADVLPIRFGVPEVKVGIWKSILEIDRVRCRGVREVK